MGNTQIEADSADTRKNEDADCRVGTELVDNFRSLVKWNIAVDIYILDTVKVQDLMKYKFVHQ
jgi:hypothetical protein